LVSRRVGTPFVSTHAGIDAAHSIISVDDELPLDQVGDGVVKYESAHLDGVASELIVRSPSSGMQTAPETVEEEWRILLEHSVASTTGQLTVPVAEP